MKKLLARRGLSLLLLLSLMVQGALPFGVVQAGTGTGAGRSRGSGSGVDPWQLSSCLPVAIGLLLLTLGGNGPHGCV